MALTTPRLWIAILAALIVASAVSANAEPFVPPPADPLTAIIHTDDVKRFADVFAASDGHPTAEQLQKGYLDPGSYRNTGLHA